MNNLILFGITTLIFLILLFVLIRFPKLFGLIIIIIIIAMILIWGPFSTLADRWLFRTFGRHVSSVESGNQFSVRGAMFRKRSLILADTQLPTEKEASLRAKGAFEDYIRGKVVKILVVSDRKTETEPWRVKVLLKGEDINRLMVQQGYLIGTGPLSSTSSVVTKEKSIEVEKKIHDGTRRSSGGSMFVRILIWLVIGLIGSTFLGQTLNRMGCAIYLLTIVIGAAIYHIVRSVQTGASVIPPVLALVVIVLFGGYFKNVTKQAGEKIGMRAGSREEEGKELN